MTNQKTKRSSTQKYLNTSAINEDRSILYVVSMIRLNVKITRIWTSFSF